MKIKVALLFLSILLFGLANAESPKLKIGILVPLTGDMASWGNDAKNAFIFANEKLGQGRFDLIFEDDKCRGADAVSAIQKLISIDKIDYASVVCAESMLVTAPLLERARISTIASVATAAAVSKAGDYIFRTWPGDLAAASVLAKVISKKYDKVALITEERGYSEEFSRAFKAAAPAGLRINEKTLASEQVDARTIFLQFRERGFKSIILNSNSESFLLTLVKQLQEIRWQPERFGAYIPGNRSFIEEAGPLSENIIFVDSPSVDGQLSGNGRQFLDEFTHRFGRMSSNDFVFFTCFEAFRLIAEGSKAVGKDLRPFLYSGHFDGLFGPYSFDQNGDIAGVEHSLKIIKGGYPQLLNDAG